MRMGLIGILADQRGIEIAARHHGLAIRGREVADGGVAADHADDAAEHVGPLPGHGERADGAARGAADGALLRIVGEVVLLAHLRKHLLDEEARVGVVQRVVLFLAMVRDCCIPRSVGIGLAEISRRDEDADGHRHLAFADEIFHDLVGRRSGPSGFVARWPSWNTSTLAGFFGLYCAGTKIQ